MRTKIRKAVSVLLAAVMMLSVICAGTASVGAVGDVEVVEVESCGDYQYTVLDDGTAEIIGYEGTDMEVVIPDELDGKIVTRIGDRAFAGSGSLTGVVISENVANIGSYAFVDCEQLGYAVIPNSVVSIGEKAFGYTLLDGEYIVFEEFLIMGFPKTAAEEYANNNGLMLFDLSQLPQDNRSALESMLEICAQNDEYPLEYWYSIYTKESYDAYLAVVEKAEQLLADENATDEDYGAMLDELYLAIDNLVYIDNPEPIKPDRPQPYFSGGKIYWECPWKNAKAAYCHVFGSDGSWLYDWQTDEEKMKDEGNGLWSYEIPEGSYDLVIFSIDTGVQTYEVVLTDENIGDTAITDTNEMIENPIDPNLTQNKTTWKSGVNGPHMAITSEGNVVGDVLCPTESGAGMVADFIVWNLMIAPDNVTTEVLENAMSKADTNAAEVVAELEKYQNFDMLDEAKELLGYTEPVFGDVTGDGVVSLVDAIDIQKTALTIKELTGQAASNADMNGDGKISVLDAIMAQKTALGMAV
ncbi:MULTISPECIES: leucine-rich repeat protein [unclassified Ruminococcus]|uniref:leucine-rich repeat protein n=1 Tax=unclassified Ruminococcus TaxID=2608920 RepID=UPI00210F0ED2|nr:MULTISPECIES: leucine-rich repeat protein [unclassified Ruminococcus]MCQ4021452.1 leucine-rich repeat protein [Ruminococcus sp. zg-924]MCQ4113897.1 leucine-rich repeat protein [Ruminococcus sp. zg-921]